MNNYRVTLSPQVKEAIKSQDPAKQAKIKKIIDIIAQKPENGVVLKGKLAGSYMMEKSSYKVIYSIK